MSESRLPTRVRRLLSPFFTRAGIVGLVTVLLLAGAAAWWFRGDDELPADAVFEVYDVQVSRDDLAARARALQALYGVTKPSEAEPLETFWRDLAKSMALGIVVEHEAEERDVSVPEREASEALARYVAATYGEGAEGRAAFVSALSDVGTSESEVLDELRRQLTLSRLFDEITADVPVPDAETLADEFAARRCVFESPETRRLRNIVSSTRQGAAQALARIRSGESFEVVARTASQDTSTAAKGGDLGYVAAEQLEEAYAEAAFAVGVGEVFGPVRTRYGWNVGMVSDVRRAGVPALADVADQLRDVVYMEDRSEVWRAWVVEQLKGADVEYAARYRPKDRFSFPSEADLAPGAAPDCAS